MTSSIQVNTSSGPVQHPDLIAHLLIIQSSLPAKVLTRKASGIDKSRTHAPCCQFDNHLSCCCIMQRTGCS